MNELVNGTLGGEPAEIDVDGDGIVDIRLVDTDGDGRADAQLEDFDGDGVPDLELYDTDGDGRADVMVETTAGVQTISVDLDGDGEFEESDTYPVDRER